MADLPYAGLRGPNYGLGFPISAPSGVDFLTGVKVISIVVTRPDQSTVTWSSADGDLTFEAVTATSLVAQRIYAVDGSDVPFVPTPGNAGNTTTCVYRFDFDFAVDGNFVAVPGFTQTFRNRAAQ